MASVPLRIRSSLLAAAVALGLGTAAQAQDAGDAARGQRDFGPPTFGLIELDAGFRPDPHHVTVHEAGGNDPVERLSGQSGCQGFIYPNPDIVLTYNAGPDSALALYAVADADTTLVVHEPGGAWACDDNSHGHNPLVRFPQARSGNYLIWVGLHEPMSPGRRLPAAELFVSEQEPVWP